LIYAGIYTDLQILFKKHFQRIVEQYESKYAIIYGRFRIERITEVVEKFILCGDYSQGRRLVGQNHYSGRAETVPEDRMAEDQRTVA
jgi:hypothetical protein